ncbi:hypothetical protein TRICHSKD4_1613 [Roseibium sp. TrichSKD4]|nr:hypothetical protein TRICHSKD4_1613 [Roseibium sp. TrichSKD4]
MWIRFAFIAERRATCATETPGTLACKQIDRFSSSDQNRFLLPFFVPKMCLTMSINENGHYHPTALPVRAGIPNAHDFSMFLQLGYSLHTRVNLPRIRNGNHGNQY